MLRGIALELLLQEQTRQPVPFLDSEFLHLAEGHRSFQVLLPEGPFVRALCFLEPVFLVGFLEGHGIPSSEDPREG